jgi:twitching motility two-component system response regulator PilG
MGNFPIGKICQKTIVYINQISVWNKSAVVFQYVVQVTALMKGVSMKQAREFKIYLLGFSGSDKQMLQRILRVSSGLARDYVLTDDHEPELNKIFIVNSDNNDSIAFWCRKFLDENKKPRVPTIFAGKRKVKGEQVYNINLPFMAAQVINILDTVTIQVLNYIPELTIGDDAGTSGVSQDFLENLANSKSSQNHQFTAMVVDDSQPVRKQLEIKLKMLGAKVALAESGEEAIKLSRDNNYDIIFLDVVMPGMDGYKVCKHIKRGIRTKDTPVIMLTGKSSPFDKVKGTLSGCDTYLTKPLQHEDFQNITKKYLPQASI